MIQVANPIYDIVFKYLMEDERIAKTLVSALLKRKIERIEMHKHRYMDEKHDKISMFRLDFDANVIQDDHTIKLVRVEFLKTWIDSGTLHSRQYLSAQYFDRDNIDSSPNADNVPVIMVYLLDHRVGNIEEPVLYVRNKLFEFPHVDIIGVILFLTTILTIKTILF